MEISNKYRKVNIKRVLERIFVLSFFMQKKNIKEGTKNGNEF